MAGNERLTGSLTLGITMHGELPPNAVWSRQTIRSKLSVSDALNSSIFNLAKSSSGLDWRLRLPFGRIA